MEYVERSIAPESLQNDAALAPLQEIEEEAIPTIEEALEEQVPGESAAPEEHVTKPQSMKVRMEAYETRGYKRGKEEAERAFAQEREQFQTRLAKLQEYELREEAAKLAKEENISESIAMRLLRAERGITAPAGEAEKGSAESAQPRDASGRFVSAKPKGEERADVLFREAQMLEKAMGISVSELLDKASEEDKQALIGGDMDMAEFVRKNTGGKRMPSVTMRTATGSAAAQSFDNMSDAQWEALNAELARGRRYQAK